MFNLLSKVFQILFSFDNLFLILTIIAIGFLWTRYNKIARNFLSLIALIGFIIFLFPVPDLLIHNLEYKYNSHEILPHEIDGIITTGGVDAKISIKKGKIQLNNQAECLTEAIVISKKYPNCKIVYAGGSSSLIDQETKSADAAKLFFESNIINSDRIIYEKYSRGTYEKIRNCYELIQPSPLEKWILITPAWRMQRTVEVCNQLGWSVIPVPVDYRSDISFYNTMNFDRSLQLMTISLKEYIGILAYRLTGRSSKYLESNK